MKWVQRCGWCPSENPEMQECDCECQGCGIEGGRITTSRPGLRCRCHGCDQMAEWFCSEACGDRHDDFCERVLSR